MKNNKEIYDKMVAKAATLPAPQLKLAILKIAQDLTMPIEVFNAALDALEAKTGSAEFVDFCNHL